MDEKSMLEQIRRSADKIEIPEALKPEAIEKKLRAEQVKHTAKHERKTWNRYAHWGGRIAAALVLCICLGAMYTATDGKGFGYVKDIAKLPSDNNDSMPEDVVKEENKVSSLGDAYSLAGDYATVYDRIPEWHENETWYSGTDEKYYNIMNELAAPGEAEDLTMGESGSSMSDNSESARETGDYSQTNVQTEGVDESDVVKTDGDYIYTLRDNKVVITDIRNNALTEAGTIAPQMKSASDVVREMYVDGDKLILIMERNVTELTNDGEDAAGGAAGYAGIATEKSRMMCTDDVYYMDMHYETSVLTYDISNRSSAKLQGEMVQDGAYASSRKIGDKVYLFTNYRINDMKLSKNEALSADGLDKWLPTAADKVVRADGIYLADEGQNGLFMASMDVNKPDALIDCKLVVDTYAEIYVSTSAIYLYHQTYEERELTTITKFELQDNGIIHAVNAATVNGTIPDTFGINEADGYLRVLTSEWSPGGETNHLTILGKNMEYVSAIQDIAPGERIYAARFLEDVGYFVTYRNTDPLFTVDLSNHFAPKIIGELKVTGFSECLHFWDETHLIGIGYETDPETGRRKGVKLSMFDISDPANVKEVARYVMQNEDNCSAMWNYKSVLISKDKNIIGFVTENFDGDGEMSYRAFSYENGTFTEQLTVGGLQKNMGTWYAMQDCRSLYCGHMLYLIGADAITSYDMDNGYAQTKQLRQ